MAPEYRVSTAPQASLTRHHSEPPPSTSVPRLKLSMEAGEDENLDSEVLSSTPDLSDSEDADKCLDGVLSDHGVSNI